MNQLNVTKIDFLKWKNFKFEKKKDLCKNIDMIFDEANALKALNH